MKNIMKTLGLATVLFLSFAFNTVEDEKKEIKVESSKVIWKGYKVTGSHQGTINLKSGVLTFEDDKLVGGEFVMDMTSINTTDLEGNWKDKLDGHLKSDDFFGVATYPEATLVFTNVEVSGKNAYKVVGDLTIKGKTNPVEFTISIYGSKATANLKIDRSKYDVRYGSSSFFDNLQDKVIYDEFDLITDLEF
ncbi:YceI family protein [Seonamhaeicola aphaedonensis]|uniref:Polyisoprenoid-binding protein YceI n=1 Tax=Seonamhaeicola aphaedonensis TaxID=1461338 RepID=A0A3D9H903_9FLAO|nr:YceI family protein [Seonamhaeicola aphaedonensis]RED45973.1 polyisoprenoid-binding protein YceI [Seonamhaeicola aphaedonensis]